ncbi:hypothetical protein D9758_008828 [Tetrapyrgos nigripes]|uniref:Polynucleotide 5'-hydroxyl-kinase GRC3 n=1 Tax=Tetrapyrgos nigripes TaxID=182062 RepID=A0A8H5CMS7_9AGAR|nr:hypothetical protein D9758_008828 [Tetrapyrgos nigripes]
MISAIAARKAAQNAQNTPPVSTRTTSSTLPTEKPSEPTKILKRKQNSNHDTSSPKPKKKKAQKKRGAPQGRYFQEPDVFEGQDDVIVIESDKGDLTDESSMDQDPVIADVDVGESVALKSRAWSPSRPVNDSSDDEGIGPSSKPSQLHQSAVGSSSVLSTFHPIPDQNLFYLTLDETLLLGVSCLSPSTLFTLHGGETIAFVGTYRLTVLSGCLSFCGLTLHASPKPHRVFAPRSSPLPILEACLSVESSSWKPASVPDHLRDIMENSDTVFILQELRTNVEGLGAVCKTFDNVFRPSRLDTVGSLDLRVTGVHMVPDASKYIHPFVIPHSWDVALNVPLPDATDSVATLMPPVHLVKGPKKSGKSTFAKTLLNRLLQRYHRVAYLECDIGQSEFTPGGIVALNIIEQPVFGPPFTHPTLPNQAHFIGALTPRTSPSHYLAAIQSLLQYYRLDVQTPVDAASSMEQNGRITRTIPLVVNTMGWAKGLGADLTAKIEDIVQPTHVFEFEAPVYDGGWINVTPTNGNLSVEGYGTPPRQQLMLEPITPSANYSAVDHRIITLLSYFYAIFPVQESGWDDFAHDLTEGLHQITASAWNVSLPLCAMPPFEVDVSSVIDKVYLSGVGSEDVVSSEIERVLNGAVVGLVSCESGTLENDGMDPGHNEIATDGTPTTGIPYFQGSIVPSPLTSITHGLALIRSVSLGGSSLHVLTPVPSKLLARTRVLVKGEMELPVWGLLDFRSWDKDDDGTVAGVSRGKVPYLQWGKGEGLGAEKRRVRRNLMRKAQM